MEGLLSRGLPRLDLTWPLHSADGIVKLGSCIRWDLSSFSPFSAMKTSSQMMQRSVKGHILPPSSTTPQPIISHPQLFPQAQKTKFIYKECQVKKPLLCMVFTESSPRPNQFFKSQCLCVTDSRVLCQKVYISKSIITPIIMNSTDSV